MEENKVLTYAELKDFCNGLSEEQLTQTVKVFLCDNDTPSQINFIEELGEDYYYFIDQEYSTTAADFDPDMFEATYETFEQAFEQEDCVFISGANVYLFSE